MNTGRPTADAPAPPRTGRLIGGRFVSRGAIRRNRDGASRQLWSLGVHCRLGSAAARLCGGSLCGVPVAAATFPSASEIRPSKKAAILAFNAEAVCARPASKASRSDASVVFNVAVTIRLWFAFRPHVGFHVPSRS